MAAVPEDAETLWIHQGREMDDQERTETWLGPRGSQEEGAEHGVGGGQDGFVEVLGTRVTNSPTSLEAHSQLPTRISFLPVSGPTHGPPTVAPVTDNTCLTITVTEVVKSSNLAGRSFSVSTG